MNANGAFDARPRRAPPRVLYIPDPDAPKPLVERVAAAMRGAFHDDVAVLVRLPALSTRETVAWLSVLAPMVRAAQASLLVSARCDLAVACGLDGVHLPARGLPPLDARGLLGEGALIGRSCHDASELAESAACDYVTLSPVFAVPGKGEPLGFARFEELVAHCSVPVLALGGLDEAGAREAVRRGARGVAVRRAIDSADDPAEAIRRFLRAVECAV